MIKQKVAKTLVDEKIVCDRCSKESDINQDGQEYLRFRNVSGYFASEWQDGDVLEADLCEKCVKDLLGPWITVKSSF